MLGEVPADLTPSDVELAGDELFLTWPDGHRTVYRIDEIRALERPRHEPWQPWGDGFLPARFAWPAFLAEDKVAIEAIKRFLVSGVIVITEAPAVPGTLELLAPRLGPLREVLFDRIHDVEVDIRGYNVAHTALALPPHNDFASYTWPPSVQALHMLENETPGGESIIVDGWALLEQLRLDHPRYFDTLCRVPVPFREFDDTTETYAVAPLIQCDNDGNVAGFRFSNQLMQTMSPLQEGLEEFYLAYHELCRRVIDPAYRSTFRLEGGQILLVAAHRVLHAREAFEPTGRRHLQDAYFELDNVANKLIVLQRQKARGDG